MDCKNLVELVTDYLEETLPPSARKRFDQHLASCPGCSVYLEQMRATLRLVEGSGNPRPPVPEALMEAFRAWNRREP